MTDDYNFEISEYDLLENWLRDFLDKSKDPINEKFIDLIKEAFLEGYRLGVSNKLQFYWYSQNQK